MKFLRTCLIGLLALTFWACECEELGPTEVIPLPELSVKSIDSVHVECILIEPDCCFITVFFCVKNSGVEASEPSYFEITIDPNQSIEFIHQIGWLEAGESRMIEARSPKGPNCFDEDCEVTIVVDAGQDVTEVDETNNSSTATFNL